MTALVLIIAPALNPDGRSAYGTRGPLFIAMVDGRRVVERSPQPLCDTCRALTAEGTDPSTTIVMCHAGSAIDALVSTVGAAARLTVLDTAQGKPIFRPWRAPAALAGGPPVSLAAEAGRVAREGVS